MMQRCISHTDIPFELHPDYVLACRQNQPQAAVCWALERATNARLQALESEDAHDLWLDLTICQLSDMILHTWGRSAISEALVALEQRGFVSVRYIKRNEAGEQVGGVYTTYQDARHDKKQSGAIVKQYHYHCDRVQAAIVMAGRDEANQGVNLEATPSAPVEAQPRGKLRKKPPRVQHTSSTPQNQQGGCQNG